MPRKKRIWYPGATYHVMSRGNRRTAIFKDDADYLEHAEEKKSVWAEQVHVIFMFQDGGERIDTITKICIAAYYIDSSERSRVSIFKHDAPP